MRCASVEAADTDCRLPAHSSVDSTCSAPPSALWVGVQSKLTGGPVHVVAAGGIFDGRGLAAALMWGAQAVWVGTRFVCAKEAGAPPRHQQAVIGAGFHDTVRTTIFTGRPMRVIKNEYIMNWENF